MELRALLSGSRVRPICLVDGRKVKRECYCVVQVCSPLVRLLLKIVLNVRVNEGISECGLEIV